MYIKTGKDLINSHVVRFEVNPIGVIGEVGTYNGDRVIRWKDCTEELIKMSELSDDTELEMVIIPLEYDEEVSGQ